MHGVTANAFAATVCTQTGFVRDSITLTAALINPAGTVTGDVDATGCNIAVYYDNGRGSVKNANIHGANYFGVVVNGDASNVSVDIANSNIHDIGENPTNGAQHGVAVYYRAFGTGTAGGKITGNTVSRYQKGGITVNGAGSTANLQDNIVTGLGRVLYIASNGIQIGYGAHAQVMRNTVSANAYTGNNCASSGGIIVVGGPGYGGDLTTDTQIVGNVLVNNDVGIYLSNWDLTGAPATATNVKAVNNTITNDAVSNVSGLQTVCGNSTSGPGYQAGVSDVGNNDKIINNTISGPGYAELTGPPTYATAIDADPSFTNRPRVHANK